MSIEKSNLFLETDGKMVPPQRYIFIQASDDGEYEVIVDASIGDLMNFMFMVWEAIKKETEDMSDQDVYDLCEVFELDYDTFRQQMRG